MSPVRIMVCLLLAGYSSLAHPGVGIVEDRKGNIFFTDLKQVWKISVGGHLTVAVRDVHTHELFIDEQDNLYGEHLWYNGERANTWGHYVWKLTPGETLSKVIPATEGYLENYSFVRDHFGRMYWADRSDDCQKLIRKNQDNTLSQVTDHCFTNIRWMQALRNDDLCVVDFQDIKRVDRQGRVKTVATRIADRSLTQFTTSNQNSIMGVWDDAQGNIYSAIASGRKVKKFSPAGIEEVVFETSIPWSPSGGLVDSMGNLWVLEYSVTNAVRVEKVIKGGKPIVYEGH